MEQTPMNTLLPDPNVDTVSNASQRLRNTIAAIRLAFTWLGVRKTLSNEQKSQAAETKSSAPDWAHPLFRMERRCGEALSVD